MGQDAEQPAGTGRRLHTFFLLLRTCLAPRKRLTLLTLGAVVAVNIFEILLPKILQLYIDAVSGNEPSILRWRLSVLDTARGQVIILPLVLLIFAAVRWGATYQRAVFQTRLGQGALFDLRSRVFNTMQNLSFAYHDKAHTGTLISNVVEDVNYSARFFGYGLYPVLEATAYMVFAFLFMFVKCPPAALASMSLMLLAMGCAYLYFRFGARFFARTRELFADAVQVFTENMEGQLVVRAFGVHEGQQRSYENAVTDLRSSAIREEVINSAMNQAFFWAAVLGMPLVLGVAIHSGRSGGWDMTPGNLLLIFLLQKAILWRSRMLTRGLGLAMWFSITADRLCRLFGARDVLDDAGTEPLPRTGPGSVELKDVSFSYPGTRDSIRGISLSISAGETIGIVGGTGSGKSTLALLLCRFYDPDAGRVLIDGKDIRDYAIRGVRDQFSLVFQETFLFSASVRDNIAYGRPDVRFEDVVHAATIAGAHDFVMELEDGYDTVVGERGVTLSGGQRQRLSIARAMLRRPRFLVLDACTSAVDPVTESYIQKSLAELRETSTVIIIAQRYSSISAADRVLVLGDGRIVESGTPGELNRPGTLFSQVLKTAGDGEATP